jgi:hypothetical protein
MKRNILQIVIGASLLVLIPALFSASANAQCKSWHVGGEWAIVQGKITINVRLKQNGDVVTGEVDREAGDAAFLGDFRYVSGQVDGTLKGDTFNVTIYWSDGLVGIYQGKVLPSGRIDGHTWDRNNHQSRATWYSGRAMKCRSSLYKKLLPPTFPAPPAAKDVKPPAPSSSSGNTSRKVPHIFVVNTTSPGTRLVIWDAGPEHPYAEVWVQIKNADPTFLVEQNKGMREVRVAPGLRYTYILTDNGKELARITIQ